MDLIFLNGNLPHFSLYYNINWKGYHYMSKVLRSISLESDILTVVKKCLSKIDWDYNFHKFEDLDYFY